MKRFCLLILLLLLIPGWCYAASAKRTSIAECVRTYGGQVIDNQDSAVSYAGTWGTSSGGDEWGSDYRWNQEDGGSDTVTFDLSVNAGEYKVYAWWHASANRCTTTPFTVYYGSSSATVDMNQQNNGGQWNLVGTYTFTGAAAEKIVITDDCDDESGKYAIADAILLQDSTTARDYIDLSDWETDTDVNLTELTTVDVESASGQKVVSVAATQVFGTDSFQAGDTVVLDYGNADQETCEIASVSAGVSITMVDNLTNTHEVGVRVASGVTLEVYDDVEKFNDNVTIAGHTTSPTSTEFMVLVRPASGEGHTGTSATGVTFNRTATDNGVFLVQSDNTYLQGLVFTGGYDPNDANNDEVVHFDACDECGLIDSIISDVLANSGSGKNKATMFEPGNTDTMYAINNLVEGTEWVGFEGQNTNGTGNVYFFNNTSDGNTYGYYVHGDIYGEARNCIATSNTTTDWLTPANWDWRSACTDEGASVTYEDGANDFRLAMEDTTARDQGSNLSASIYPFDTDALGNSRPSGNAWDMGFHENQEIWPETIYTWEPRDALPTDESDLFLELTTTERERMDNDDDIYFAMGSTRRYPVLQFKVDNDSNADPIYAYWKGKSNVAPSSYTVYLQIWDDNGSTWETLDSDNSTAANIEFELRGQKTENLSNYYITDDFAVLRIYQDYSGASSDSSTVTTDAAVPRVALTGSRWTGSATGGGWQRWPGVYFNGKTYVVYGEKVEDIGAGEYHSDVYANVYTHSTSSWGTAQKVMDQVTWLDYPGHHSPRIVIDSTGLLYVVAGHGNNSTTGDQSDDGVKWCRSTNAEDITAWSTAYYFADQDSSYGMLAIDSNDNIYCITRTMDGADAGKYQTTVYTSTASAIDTYIDSGGADPWTAVVVVQHSTDSAVDDQRILHGPPFFDSNGDYHHFYYATYSSGDDLENMAYMVYDVSNTRWEKADGTQITIPVNEDDGDLLPNGDDKFTASMALDNTTSPVQQYLLTHYGDDDGGVADGKLGWYTYDNGWSTDVQPISTEQSHDGPSDMLIDGSSFIHVVTYKNINGIDEIVLYFYDGTDWVESPITTNSSFSNVLPAFVKYDSAEEIAIVYTEPDAGDDADVIMYQYNEDVAVIKTDKFVMSFDERAAYYYYMQGDTQ